MKRYTDDGNHELVGIYDALSEDNRYLLLSIARRLEWASKPKDTVTGEEAAVTTH